MTFLEIVFLLCVILIWFMIGYQFLFSIFGYINFIRSMKEKQIVDTKHFEFPTCTILIPAHNEEMVIGNTIDAMLKLEYPEGRLKIMVINDGSKDQTGNIIKSYAKKDSRVVLFNVPEGMGGKGKSRALNLGIQQVSSEVIAIYDADNTPDPKALYYLVASLVSDKELGAVIGKFRTVNKNKNILTRFINIETLSFQSMLQAGRWQLHNIATLPGTNFVMWKWLVDELNGWDEEALTEDSELSIRIYELGYKIKFLPYAITYEQEPEKWSVWIKQRVRWVRGNNYVLAKFVKEIPKFKNKKLRFDLLYTLALYYVFFVAVLVSDLLFILSLFQVISIPLPGPYTLVWIIAIVLFMFEILLAISFDHEDNWQNVGLRLIMYFTYCQFWIYVMLRAFYLENIRKAEHQWDKTVRFEIQQCNKITED